MACNTVILDYKKLQLYCINHYKLRIHGVYCNISSLEISPVATEFDGHSNKI